MDALEAAAVERDRVVAALDEVGSDGDPAHQADRELRIQEDALETEERELRHGDLTHRQAKIEADFQKWHSRRVGHLAVATQAEVIT